MRHVKKNHTEDDNVKFEWKVKRKFVKPLQRQLYEAKMTNKTANNVILNTKHEFNSLNMNRLSMMKADFQCEVCSAKFQEKAKLEDHVKHMHEHCACSYEDCEYNAIGTIDLKYQVAYRHVREQ